MLHQTRDATLLRTRQQLEAEGWRLDGVVFRQGQALYLPVYEGAMLRPWGASDAPGQAVSPQYWVPAARVMQAVARVIEEESQRRPRRTGGGVAQLCALARAPLRVVRRFDDATEMDIATLEAVLRTISFVGPAMNAARFARFRERILALDERPVWTRTFTLHAGRKALRARGPGSAA